MHDTDRNDVWVQLVTRVPLRLHREAKLRSITSETTLTAFIVSALRDKLEADTAASTTGSEA